MTIQNTGLQLHIDSLSIKTLSVSSAIQNENIKNNRNSSERKPEISKIGKSKDTLDIPSETSSYPLRSCILVSKGDDTDEKVSMKKSKSVHFADSLGKPLKSVKTLYDNHDEYLDLSFLSLRSTTRRTFPVDIFKRSYNNSFGNVSDKESKLINFKQPVTSKDFQSRVEKENICLENVLFREYGVFATIAVKNISFQKEITVRYSFDKWESFHVLAANFVPGSSTGITDTFSFEIFPPMTKEDATEVQFALSYAANGKTYWDSNFGNNYIVKFKPKGKDKEKFSEMSDCNGFILARQNFIGWST